MKTEPKIQDFDSRTRSERYPSGRRYLRKSNKKVTQKTERILPELNGLVNFLAELMAEEFLRENGLIENTDRIRMDIHYES